MVSISIGCNKILINYYYQLYYPNPYIVCRCVLFEVKSMGMYTELEYTVKLKSSEVENVKQFLSHNRRDDYTMPWEHPLATDDRWSMLGVDWVMDGEYLMGRDSIKNYTATYYKYFDLLKSLSEKVLMFRTLYSEDDDWTDMLKLSNHMKEYFNRRMYEPC